MSKRSVEDIKHSLTCSISEASQYLGVSRLKIRGLIKLGEVRVIQNGSRILIVTASLDNWAQRIAS